MANLFWMAGLIGFVLVAVSLLVQAELSALSGVGNLRDARHD